MWLTRRGLATLGLAVLAVLLSWWFSPRALNAVAVPAVVALLVGVASVVYTRYTGAAVSEARPGFAGETRPLTVRLDGRGLATVTFELPEGLADDHIESTVSLPHTFEHTIELGSRGVYEIGTATIRFQDPLGLVKHTVETDETTTLLVYPRRYSVAVDVTRNVFAEQFEAERQEFESLREYEHGDPLSHIHWKSSAKRDELFVIEFAEGRSHETVTIAASAAGGMADEMARTVGTLTELALDAGFDVGIAVPDGTVDPGCGSAHRETVYGLLARTDAGPVPQGTDSAEIVVTAGERRIRNSPDSTTIEIGNWSATLSELRNGPADESQHNGSVTADSSTRAAAKEHSEVSRT